MALRVLFLMLIGLLAGGAGAAALPLPEAFDQLPLGGHVLYLEDPEERLDVAQIRRSGHNWQQNQGDFSKGFNDSAWWLKLQLANTSQRPRAQLLEIGYPLLDQVEVFVFDRGLLRNQYRLGDSLPYGQRPIDHPHFLIPIQWEPLQELEIYIRIRSSSAVQAPLALWSLNAFAGHEHGRMLLNGLLFGALLLIAGYNLLLYVAFRDRTHIVYFAYVLSMDVLLASLGGHTYRYLWPGWPLVNDHGVVVSLSLVLLFAALFNRYLLDLQSMYRWVDLTSRGFIAVCGLQLVAALVLPYRTTIATATVLAALGCHMAFIIGVWAWRQGRQAGRIYTLSWTLVFVSSVVLVLSKFNILPSNWLTDNALQVGVVLEVLLLSLALAERINGERRLRYEAQASALETVRRTHAALEQRVQERARELDELAHQLDIQTHTDQLTGVHNRRHLQRRLEEEWERCLRKGHSLAVILLDIDFFKKVNDTHGHDVGDLCLRHVAQRLRNIARWPCDDLARFGGEEFCMLLPETDEVGALAVAERARRVVEQEPVVTAGLRLNVTISLGVALMVPDEATSWERLLKYADDALYAAKAAGRNRVQLYQAPGEESQAVTVS